MPFKAGYDANRFDHNEGIVEFRDQMATLLKEHSWDAAKLLIDTVASDTAPLKLRIICAKDILDRSTGRAIDIQTHLSMSQQTTNKDYGSMSDAELEAIVRQLPTPTHTPSKKRQSIDESMVIDGEFKET